MAPPPAVDDTEAPAAVVTGLSLSDYETRIRDTSLAAEARLAMAKEYVARAAVEGSAADLSDALKILTSITGPDKTAALKEVVDRTIHAAELERAIANVARGSEIMPLLQARQALLWWHTGKATKASELADGLQLSDDGVRERVQTLQAAATQTATVSAHKVGLLLPLTGPFAGIGQSIRRTLEYAWQEQAQAKTMEWIVADSAGDARTASKAMEKLVLEDHVVAVVGPVGSDESEAAARVAQAFHVPMLALTADDSIARIGEYIFTARFSPQRGLAAMVKYCVDELKITHFGVLYPKDRTGQESMLAFWSAVEQAGGQIVAVEDYARDAEVYDEPIKAMVGRKYLDARENLNRYQVDIGHGLTARSKARREFIKNIEPVVLFEALFIPDAPERVRLILPYLRYYDVEPRTGPDQDAEALRDKHKGELPPLVQILGLPAWNTTSLLQAGVADAQNAILFDVFTLREHPDFVRDFAKAFGRRPTTLDAEIYDAARMFAEAVVAHASDRTALRNGLSDRKDFVGETGAMSFNAHGEMQKQPIVLTYAPTGVRRRLPVAQEIELRAQEAAMDPEELKISLAHPERDLEHSGDGVGPEPQAPPEPAGPPESAGPPEPTP